MRPVKIQRFISDDIFAVPDAVVRLHLYTSEQSLPWTFKSHFSNSANIFGGKSKIVYMYASLYSA